MNWYVSVKMFEALCWLSCSGFFISKMISCRRLFYAALAGAFLIFGLADAIEYFTAGALPLWLWIWKIVGGLLLFFLLVYNDYMKRGAVALAPWRFIAASLILLFAIFCMLRA